jgi:hypothetical protein
VCDGIDNNCNNQIDEGCDPDNDNYCDCGQTFVYGSNLTGVCPGTNTTDANAIANTCDCNESNSAINPGAADICGNGVDEDCSGSDLSCQSSISYLITSNGGAHGITRGHNRKFVYHPGQGRYFVFVLLDSNNGRVTQYTSSTDLISWTPLKTLNIYPSWGSSSADYRLVGDIIYFSYVAYINNNPNTWEFHTGKMQVEPNGVLTLLEDNPVAAPAEIQYGSLHRASDDHFWYFGRQAAGGTTPVVMRNPYLLDVANWDTNLIKELIPGVYAQSSTAHWGFSLSNGKMVSLSWLEGMGPSGGARLFLSYFDGVSWRPSILVGPEMPNDAPDDLRPGIAMDENKNIHVVLVPLVGNPNSHPNTNRNLMHIKISPPYDSSSITVIDNAILDLNQDIISIQIKPDRRPGMEDKIYCTFSAYNGTNTSVADLFLTRFNGSFWEGTQIKLLNSVKDGWLNQSNPNADDVTHGLIITATGASPADIRIVNYDNLMY